VVVVESFCFVAAVPIFFSGTVVVACDVLCVVGVVGVRRSATTTVDRF